MEAKLYYNSIAKGYKKLYHEEQINKINLVKNKFIKEGKILDLGSGDGVLNQFLSKKIELISFDLSKELLRLNPNKNENKFQGESHNLPFKDKEFDAIYSFTAMQDIIKLEKTLKEIKRTLKNDGQLIISFLKISKKKEEIEQLIKKYYKIKEIIEEEKDLIFILK